VRPALPRILLSVALAAGAVAVADARAATPGVVAHGSVEQVYATGLAAKTTNASQWKWNCKANLPVRRCPTSPRR
jgi:hypothetical protein